jgi:ribosomal protein S18 acetylase RimI-like enzyme
MHAIEENEGLRKAKISDLEKIALCHQLAFLQALSTRLGKKIVRKMLEWYLADPKRFLLWIEKENQCIGYVGGMVSDGSQVHGSASGMIQYAFNELFCALVVRPWLWFHPEIVSRFKLILKNIYFRIAKYNKPYKERKKHLLSASYVGLVVIGVSPEHQGKGVGGILFQEFENQAKSRGYNLLRLTVLQTNTQAIKAYQKNGWVITETKGNSVAM